MSRGHVDWQTPYRTGWVGSTMGAPALGQFASPYFVASGPASPQRTPTYASGCRPARARPFELRAQPEARAELIWLATCPSAGPAGRDGRRGLDWARP